MTQISSENQRKAVREQYARVAENRNTGCGCSNPSCCQDSDVSADDVSIALGYSIIDVNRSPAGANMGLGCGNPQAIAALKTGETVLDLGCGGGFDCFLAVDKVGPSGKVIGVDMTPEMISKARANATQAGYPNVEFRLGEIENLPVADNMVDVILSNCVINLSPEKLKVFQESFRVLKPGGRLAISDIVATTTLPEHLKTDLSLLTGCMAGASLITEIETMLYYAGFETISIQPADKSKEFIKNWAPDTKIEEYVVSATIEAIKPAV